MSLTKSFALASALALAVPTVAMAAPTAPVAQHVVVDNTAAPTPAAEKNDYAQREQQDKKVADYQGGSTVVIGISGGAIIVILLILLLI
ncbi:MAG TPA: hypothetical protein VGM90_03980 [Kofleriaceae bacterium]